jgi:hypothetical protein
MLALAAPISHCHPTGVVIRSGPQERSDPADMCGDIIVVAVLATFECQ